MNLTSALGASSRLYGFSWDVQLIPIVGEALDTQGPDFTGTILSESEQMQFERYRLPKRRREWLAGRIAAKRATIRHLRSGCPLSGVSITAGPDRAPSVEGHPALTVSITHSASLAIAVVAGYRIGVDIERVESRPAALVRYFFSDHERSLLGGMEPSAPVYSRLVTTMWSRKEAVVKLLRLGGTVAFSKIPVHTRQVLLSDPWNESIALLSYQSGEYSMSIAIPGDRSTAEANQR